MKQRRLLELILGLAFGCSLFFALSARSATSNATVNVGLTIPTSADSGSGGKITPPPPPPPPGDTAPTISNVIVNVSFTTVAVSWSAVDDGTITGISFVYGLNTDYGSTGTVTGSYATALSGLAPNSTYFYKISVSDNVGHTTTQTGTFVTGSAADTTPPVIENVTVATGIGSATISWATNEQANTELKYGLTASYGATILPDANYTLGHSVQLAGLVPNTTYYYQIIAADQSGNSASKAGTLKTAPDSTPPADVSNLTLTVAGSAIQLQWTNPADIDFSGVKIVRKVGSPSVEVSDGTLAYTGTGQSFTDSPPAGGTLYYYTVFSFDTSFNYSGGVFKSGQVTAPAGEICDNGIDDNGNGLIDCGDTACAAAPVCQTQPPEICNNGLDDNHNGKIDCADSACGGASYCQSLSPEICNNRIDDDGNGQTDCADVACFGFSGCAETAPPKPYEPPPSTVPAFARVTLNDLRFLAGNRHIPLQPREGRLAGLAGTTLSLVLPNGVLPAPSVSLVVNVDGQDNHQFVYEQKTDSYYADITVPPVGRHSAFVQIDYGAGQLDTIPVSLDSLPQGSVWEGARPLGGAMVSLFTESGEKIATDIWGAPNPRLTNANGTYGWVIPNGRYYLSASKDKYYIRRTQPFLVENNIVNSDLDLVHQPPDLFDDLTPTSTVPDAVRVLGKNALAKTKAAAQIGLQTVIDTKAAVDNFKNDVAVQETAAAVVAPTVVSVAAIGTISLISWANLLPFLRFLFLQPLMLLGLRRRRGWGQVYNSLNKLPIDLATVRLINNETGRVIQSRVTDAQGRYAFVASPGNYRIEATKANFLFPSRLLTGLKDDGRRTDVYHGEVIAVSEKDAVITANIPFDPVGEHKRPMRMVWQQFWRRMQIILSWLGMVTTAVSLYLSPRWYVWAMLGGHILLFIIFRRLAVPPKVKSWGIVYDGTTKKPVGRTVARLFNFQFNKLVATQVTDGRGRYYFLAGDNQYYVTYDHPEYAPSKTDVIDLSGKEAENIAIDIALKKSQILSTGGSQTTQISPPIQVSAPPPPPSVVSPEKNDPTLGAKN
ncbi:MAG: hypothetical protein HY983_02000 [Candidatus Magasanikbacteria bacterium]|nr:hypothetical protein [Candidatus Magasanikbacteria bacterium]